MNIKTEYNVVACYNMFQLSWDPTIPASTSQQVVLTILQFIQMCYVCVTLRICHLEQGHGDYCKPWLLRKISFEKLLLFS